MKRSDNEHKLQVVLFQYLALNANRNVYYFAIPNAGKRSLPAGARMKKEGLTPGLADICLMFSEGRVAWLELKTLRGKQTPAQKNFEEVCDVLGHRYGLAHSLDEAIDILKRWGALK